MHYLAIARYRLLTTIRSSAWVFGVSAAAVVLPLLFSETLVWFGIGGAGWRVISQDMLFGFDGGGYVLERAAVLALIVALLHLVILGVATQVFINVRRRSEAADSADLMDTAPVTPSVRFWGDAAGVLAAAGCLHLCTLPLLAYVLILGPFPALVLVWFEVVVAVFLLLAGAQASWSARTRHPSRNALLVSAVGVVLMVMGTRANTRWLPFRDALAGFVNAPSAASLPAIGAAVNSPALLLTWLAVLYAVLITFYYLHAVRLRPSEQRQEMPNALQSV